MLQLIKRMVKEDAGMETVEYAVMAALIVVATVTAVKTLGSTIITKFTDLNTNLSQVWQAALHGAGALVCEKDR